MDDSKSEGRAEEVDSEWMQWKLKKIIKGQVALICLINKPLLLSYGHIK